MLLDPSAGNIVEMVSLGNASIPKPKCILIILLKFWNTYRSTCIFKKAFKALLIWSIYFNAVRYVNKVPVLKPNFTRAIFQIGTWDTWRQWIKMTIFQSGSKAVRGIECGWLYLCATYIDILLASPRSNTDHNTSYRSHCQSHLLHSLYSLVYTVQHSNMLKQ